MSRRQRPNPNQLNLLGLLGQESASPLVPEPALPARKPVQDMVLPAAWPPRLTELGRQLPAEILLGTSSWSFPGWKNIVYADAYPESILAQGGLCAYAQHPLLRTVGLDRSFYAPLLETDWAAYARQLPHGFPMVIKVWEEITLPMFPGHPRYGERAGRRCEHFLDADTLEDLFLKPLREAFGAHHYPLVLEFSPMSKAAYHKADAFYSRLDAFLSSVPRDFHFAVELRNAELITHEYGAVLRKNGAGHVYNRWTRTPSIEQQRERVGDPWLPWAVVRVLLPEGGTYASRSAECAPFDRLVSVDDAMRQHVVDLALDAVRGKTRLHVIVNNKAEGSAPLTCVALAERIVSALGRRG